MNTLPNTAAAATGATARKDRLHPIRLTVFATLCHLDVTKSTVGTADEQTQASWQTPDIRAELAELRARGVKVEDYDLPGLKTEDGIADIGFAWAAWIIDPGKNALGILQLKQ
jgi:hypothetical protein